MVNFSRNVGWDELIQHLTIQTRLNITSQRISQRLGSKALLDRNNMLQIFSFCSCKVCSLYCNVLARDLGRWLLERWVGKQGRVKVGLGPARRAGGHSGLRIDWFWLSHSWASHSNITCPRLPQHSLHCHSNVSTRCNLRSYQMDLDDLRRGALGQDHPSPRHTERVLSSKLETLGLGIFELLPIYSVCNIRVPA